MMNHYPEKTFTIRTGDRIAQCVFMRADGADGADGFGADGFCSTGGVGGVTKVIKLDESDSGNSGNEMLILILPKLIGWK